VKIVVTGGSGLLAQSVIADLVQHGHEVLSLDQRPHPTGYKPAWVADLSEPGALFEACHGAGGVVHLAAFAAPGKATDCTVFNTNVTLTYNVLKAAQTMGVKRVVQLSSIAAYGYIYGPADAVPDYLPIDESHPSRPTDPYGLSKVVSERIADSFATCGGMQIASLRFPGITFDPEFKLLRKRMDDPGPRRSGFWAYLDSRDAATACRLALEADMSGHRVFNVAAPTTSMREPTEDLIRRYLPGVTDIRSKDNARWSGVDGSRAERELGFRARYLWDSPAQKQDAAVPGKVIAV
jgi:nucleoside-diphosphate-sugar epimerase